MRPTLLIVGLLVICLMVACDRDKGNPKPAGPAPNPKPVPSSPQASTTAVDSSQPRIVPSPSTQKRGPDTPAVGSVAQPPRKAGGDANPTVSTPQATSPGAR
jgi:hypothetical protein